MGLSLTEEELDNFSEDQLDQLFALYKETQKPVDPDNPLGDNPHVVQAPDKES